MSFERGREPVSQLLSGEFGDSAANDLLKQFFRGFPVSELRAALRSADGAVVKRAAWLLSELGGKATPLINEVPHLLIHSERTVRFWALDALIAAGDPTCGEAFALAIALVEDSDSAVVWKALLTIADLPLEHLSLALAHLESRLAAITEWLINTIDTSGSEAASTVEERLRDENPAVRRIAAVAAARVGADSGRLLIVAAASDDADVSSFAQERLRRR